MKANDYLDDKKPSASSFLDSDQPTGFKQKSLAELLSTYGQPDTLNEGAKVFSGLPGILEVGARRGYAGIGKVEQGALSILGDLLNSESLRGASDVVGDRARQIENSAVLQGKRSTGFAPDSIVNDLPEAGANAVSSVIQTAPSLLAGAVVPGAALPALFGQTFSQEYAQGKDAGLTPLKAAGRAVPMAAFEVAGEKLGGFDSLAAGLRKATAGNGVADLGSAMLSSALKEIPSEEFTTTGQFLTDKAPGIGINQDATLADYGQQVKDTALATALQSGAMGAGGRILQGRSAPGQSVMSGMDQAQQPEQPAAQQVINPDAIMSAISQATSNVKPSAAAFLDADTTEAANVSQTTQQSAAGVDTAATGLQPDNGTGSPAVEPVAPNANAGSDSAAPNGAMPASDIPDGASPVQQSADLTQATTEQSSAVEPVVKDSLTTQSSKKEASKPRANTLLSAIDGLGGIDNKYKWDISGEQKFARGGYNKIFKNASTKTLEQHIENGDLDEFLPYDMRSTVTDDPTAGRDYLADRIRNGDRVLPYDVELEAKQSKAYEQLNPQDDIAAIGDDIDLEEINRLLSEAGYVERETAADNASPASTGQIENAQPESANSNADGGQGTQRSDAREAAPANEVARTPGSNEREGTRQHVEAIVRRRAAANQLGKLKPFDNALKLAKDFMAGEPVSPGKFKNAATMFANDKPLADAFTALQELAKSPAKESRQTRRSAVDIFTEQINNAKTTEELRSIARNIQLETGVLSDSAAQQLDDLVMDKIDGLQGEAETETANAETAPVSTTAQSDNVETATDIAESETSADDALIEQYGLPSDTAFVEGRGFNKGRWSAKSGPFESISYHDDKESALKDLQARINDDKQYYKDQKLKHDLSISLATIIKRGEMPNFSQWKGVLPFIKENDYYVKLSEISNFLSEYLDVPKNNIMKNISVAASYQTSDGGAKYPVVLFKKLPEVFNENSEKDVVVERVDDNPAFKRADDNELSNAAKEYFGITLNKNEAGYILPDGVMLDFSGKHMASKMHHKYMSGERSVDHRELFGENLHNGSSLDGLLESKNGNDAMLEFMRKTGAMRVDFQSGVASIALPPTQKQIATLGNGMRGEYLAIEYFDPESGRIIDDIEIESANPIKVKKFFDDAVTKKPDENAPMFKRDPMLDAIANIKRQQNQVVDQVQSYVDAIAKGWKNAPTIQVVYDMNDDRIPEAVRRENDRQLSQGATGQPQGFIIRGKVYIVASEMNSAEDVTRVLFHESLGHYGLRGIFDNPALIAALNRVATMRATDVAKKAKEYGLDIKNERDRLIAAEEVLAELAETRPEIGVVKQVIAAIRSWLRDNVPYFRNMELSDAEIIRDYILPARRFVENGGQEQTAGDVVAAFERSAFQRKETDQPKRSIIRDELGRFKSPTGIIYDKTADIVQILANKIAFGTAPKELRRLTRLYKADIQKAMEAAGNVVETMSPMSQADRALVSDVVEKMVANGTVPPESIVNIATGIQNAMDIQTDELVNLGMLSQDSADRWRGKYLPRFYMRENTEGVKAWVGRMLRNSLPVRGIGGNSLKGRGLFEEVNVNEVQKFEALGWEVRDPLWKKNRQGELELVDENKVVTPEKVVVWRDFTPSERAEMGENRDALFRFVMGYTSMQNDIALGRLFDSIAKNQEWTRARASDGYVKVPDSEIPETSGVKRYGNLAGLYVKKEIIDHISQYEESSELWKYYRKALSFWKAGKTVLNPVSHVNNVVSNLTMAHFAGVSYWDAHKYVMAIKDLANNAPMVKEAKDRGLMTGDITRAELMSDMPDDIKAMMQMQESAIKRKASTVFNIVTFGLSKPMGKAYRFEDDFFKYLIYRDARKNGLSPDDAVDYATKYIFTYDDLPKGARTVRDAAIPFFAYTYKAVPALTHTLFNYPWRFAAPAAAVWGANAIAFALAAGDDDDDWQTMYEKGKELEEEERKNLPPWMQGRSALGASKAIRLGTDDKTELPVYMDISRMIPGGDIFDVTNQADGLPVPAPIMPSNPVLTTIAAMFWNKDTFTGKEVVDLNDTGKEAARKRAGWLLKQISPGVSPTGYHFDRLLEASAQMADDTIRIPMINFGDPVEYTGYGRDGLPVQSKYAVGQTFGIKARPIDLERSAEISRGQDNKEIRSITAEIRQAARLLDQNAISQREYDRRVEDAEQKIEAIQNK